MAWVIKDTSTNEYYRQRAGDGWYSSNIEHARMFGTEKQAQKTIHDAGHHVTYPGNRSLVTQEVRIAEV
jgi:hypothetical protein